MRRRAIIVWLVGLLAVGSAPAALAGEATPAASPATAPPAVEWADCPFDFAFAPGLAAGRDVRCGSVTVPLRHENPDGPTIRLAVAVLPSTGENPASEPLILLNGGPGQETEAVLPAFSPLFPGNLRPLLERQPVVLFDQRGVGYSEPSLTCPFDSAGGQDATEPLPIDAESAELTEATVACLDGLAAEGIDLEAFDTAQNAADVDAIRRALRAERVDLLGISYGSRLALAVMRDFPAAVRSVVLASPFPPQADFLVGTTVSFDAALDRLVAACEADPDCAAANPDLEGDFAEAAAALAAEPVELDVTNPLTGESERVAVDDTLFVSSVYAALFIGPLLPAVPAAITGAAAGDYGALSQILPILSLLREGVSSGMLFAVQCQDEVPFEDESRLAPLVEEAGVRPEIADPEVTGIDAYFDICAEVGLEASSAVETEPVVSDVPTLIVAGAFDPITPPAYAEAAAETLPNSTVVVVPTSGHDTIPAGTGGDCVLGIVEAFLANPEAEPATECLDELEIDLVPAAAAAGEAGAGPGATPSAGI